VLVCLDSKQPTCVYWGPEHVLLYNDAYRSLLGEKHPGALGRTAREVWAELWNVLGPRFATVLERGEAFWREDELLPLRSRGFIEERYFNFSLSAIRGDDNVPIGILNTASETTSRVISERRTHLLSKLAEGMVGMLSTSPICSRAAELLAGGLEDVPFCLIYKSDLKNGGREAKLIASAGLEACGPASPHSIALRDEDASAHTWPLKRIAQTETLALLEDLQTRFRPGLRCGIWPESARAAALIPIRATSDEDLPVTFLILGINPRCPFDDAYRSFVERVADILKRAVLQSTAYDQEKRSSAERRAILECAIDRSQERVFLIGNDGNLVYVNAAAARSLNYTREELVGMHVRNIDPDLPPLAWETYLREYAKGAPRTFETRHKTKDGRIFPVEVTSSNFTYDGVDYRMALVRDISARKQAEEEARRAETQRAMLEFGMDQVHEGAFLIPLGGDERFLYVNAEASRSLGYSRDQLLRMGVPDIDPDYSLERVHREFGGEVCPTTFESRHMRKDGRIFPVEIEANYFEFSGKRYVMALTRDISKRKATEAHLHLLMHEVNHRAKNLLAVIQAIVSLTIRDNGAEDFESSLRERIAALAASHDLLVENEWKGVDLRTLITTQLAHFRDLLTSRLILDGPSVQLKPEASQALGMALHELATNSAKYGAFSSANGSVRLVWNIETNAEGSSFSICWSEHGGPAPKQPERQGFGHRVIVQMAEYALNARASLTYQRSGLIWHLKGPVESIVELGSEEN